MNRSFRRLQAGKNTLAKKAQDGPSIGRSSPHATASGSTLPRKTHSPTPALCSNDPNERLGAHTQASSSWTIQTISKTDLPHHSEIFNFTRGRFVINEQYELAQRHRTFNIDELARRAAHAVKADRCLSIKKCSDGMYNRVLLLSMDNGEEVIAKIPNPNSGQPHFTNASEVATMKFAREILGTPLPKIYAWSSRAQETLVGAEFILMENMNGVELEHCLPGMKIGDRLEVVKAVAGYQKSWASVSFKQFGSLYFPEDIDGPATSTLTYIDHEGREVNDPRFVVGPSTGREWFDDGRANIKFDRGPWKFLEDYHIAIGNREIASVQHISHLPPSPMSLHSPGLYQPTREKKINALETYLKLFKYLLPENPYLGSAHLWHSDLHAGNIFVDPANPTQIVGLIDWQSTELSPLYFQARQPHFIDYAGPTVHGLERPVLTADFAQLDASEKRTAQALFLQQSLCALYMKIVHQECPKIFECLEFQESSVFALLLLARNLLIDGEASYMAQTCELEDIWETLPGARGTAFPLSFSAADLQAIRVDMEDAALGMDAMQRLRESLGDLLPEQGYVPHDQQQGAVDALSHTRDQVLSEFAKSGNNIDSERVVVATG